jgi:hypothetical protein
MPPKTPVDEHDEASPPKALEVPVSEHPLADLEKMLIAEYLRNQGTSIARLHELPTEQAATMMREALSYAAEKLAELEKQTLIAEEVHKAAAPLK